MHQKPLTRTGWPALSTIRRLWAGRAPQLPVTDRRTDRAGGPRASERDQYRAEVALLTSERSESSSSSPSELCELSCLFTRCTTSSLRCTVNEFLPREPNLSRFLRPERGGRSEGGRVAAVDRELCWSVVQRQQVLRPSLAPERRAATVDRHVYMSIACSRLNPHMHTVHSAPLVGLVKTTHAISKMSTYGQSVGFLLKRGMRGRPGPSLQQSGWQTGRPGGRVFGGLLRQATSTTAPGESR